MQLKTFSCMEFSVMRAGYGLQWIHLCHAAPQHLSWQCSTDTCTGFELLISKPDGATEFDLIFVV